MPATLEKLLSLSTSTLKNLGCFRPQYTGVLRWQHGDQVTARVQIIVYLNHYQPKVYLFYQLMNGEAVADEIYLKYVQSNLGRGGYWLFLCPLTGNPCRKIYLHNGHFKSRAALPSFLAYQCQTVTLSFRSFHRLFSLLDKLNDQKARYRKRYAKTHYKGKLTRWALKLADTNSRLAETIQAKQ